MDKGLTGLANLGNTCFMNTCIQLLSHTQELYKITQNKELKQDSLFKEFVELRKMMWSENCTINPGRWLHCVQKTAAKNDLVLFTGFAQNDLPEFLLFIINNFHDSIARKVTMNINGTPQHDTDDMAVRCYQMMKNMYQKDYSEILKLFFGIHVSQIVNPESNKVLSNSPEPFFVVELPIPTSKKNISIYDCFSSFSDPERLDGDNAWFNDKTNKKEDVDKQMVFWSFPDILVVAIKRFTNLNRKINTFIDAPLDDLNLTPYVKGYEKDKYKYQLFGIANHVGNAMGGHYFAYIKGTSGQWYEFNDTNVKPIKENDVVSQKAYVFFYRKKE